MTPEYNNLPIFTAFEPRRLPEGLFAEAVCGVVRETGCDDAQAMRVVEAVLGPLRLLPPPDSAADRDSIFGCPVAYSPETGGWFYCHKDHEFVGEDPEFHYNDAPGSQRVEWDEHFQTGLVFKVPVFLDRDAD